MNVTSWNREKTGFVLLVAIGLVAPFVVYPIFLMKALCFALFACALNLLMGYAGLLSFGHAAFFGGAGYVTGYAMTVLNWPVEAGLLAGTVFGLVLGTVFGGLAIRRQGLYFTMVTLALAQMVFFLCLQIKATGGEDGLQGIPRGVLFGVIDLNKSLNLYYLVFAVFLVGFVFIYRVVHSPFGNVLKAIRENEPRAISLGYNAERHKLVAFILSAGLAGLAGSTKAIVFQLASLTDVHWSMSGEAVLMTLVGGMGTLFGPVVGAVFVVSLDNLLAPFGSWFTVVMGVIFVACVLLFKKGIVGSLRWPSKPTRTAAGPAVPAATAGTPT
ncbi:MAG: branched-chain amino acid ABC transporter permease [Pseudomonadota bacterium]